jgi:peptidoglycan/xylan/chitin deacetylase (PgdA/CDA1 family)
MILRQLKRQVGNLLFQAQEVRGRYRLGRSLPPGADVVCILMYHGLEDDPERRRCNSLDVPAEACLREVRFHLRQGYEAITPGELAEADSPGKGARGRLLVSFDDGYLDTFAHLQKWLTDGVFPVLLAICPAVLEEGAVYWHEEVQARLALMQKPEIVLDVGGGPETYRRDDGYKAMRRCCGLPREQIRAFLRQLRQQTPEVSAEAVRRAPHVHALMGWSELRALAATGNCTFAAHSLYHEPATALTAEELAEDARECRRRIEDKLGVECRDYVYPFGSPADFSEATDAVLADSGFLRSYTTVHRLNAVGEGRLLGRFPGTGYGDSLTYFGHLWRARHAAGTGRNGD